MTATGPKECPNAHDVGAPLHLLVQALDRVRAVQLGSMLAGERHVGQHIMFAGIHQISQLGPARAELIGHALPCFARMFTVGLFERLPDRGSDRVLAARDMSESVAHPVNVTLPSTFIQRERDPGFEFCPFGRVGQRGLARSLADCAASGPVAGRRFGRTRLGFSSQGESGGVR